MKLRESITSERCCILHSALDLRPSVVLDLNIKYTIINIHYTTDSLLQSYFKGKTAMFEIIDMVDKGVYSLKMYT